MYKDELYKKLSQFVFDNTGIWYGEKDYYRLDGRIDKMLKTFEFESQDDLLAKFKQSSDTAFNAKVIDICTNNETFFFRDQKPFDALKEHILPELIEEKKETQINIWSAASSSGQEPLSILMTLFEKYSQYTGVSLDASDISKTILEKAKSGVYNSLEAQRGLPIQLLIKYFTQVENNCWKVKDDLLSKIKYFEFNLFSNLYPTSKYHIVFCRNVLIYQNMENKNEILDKIYKALKPGGYLIMGAGESLIGSQVKLEQKSLNGTMVFQKEELKKTLAA